MPLSEVVGEKEPQEFAGVQLQVTPALAESLSTFAATEVVAERAREAVGACAN